MSTATVTKFIVGAGVLAWVAWDIFVAANETPGDTISEVMLAAARRSPVIPFAVGFVMGHLFFPQGTP
jgi:hypothetical protein